MSSLILNINKSCCLLMMFFFCALPATAQQNFILLHPTDTEEQVISKAANIVPTSRQLRWQKLELTGFLHFGINTFSGREWGTGKEDPRIFNPTSMDADQWIRVLKNAGIKQVILTAKHHDGFCLWPSKYTEYSVKNSPWRNGKGDVVKEVANACKKFNVGFGVYLSPWDMNSELYGTDAYNDYFLNQLTELLTQYGQIDEVWFDGANGEGPNGKRQIYDFTRWYNQIRKLQPSAVIAVMGPDVRWVGTESGHGRETEWSVLPVSIYDQEMLAANFQNDISFKPQGDMTGDDLGSRDKIRKAKGLVWYPAETDVSIRPGWFYHEAEDSKVKTAKELMEIYFNSVGRNGVLLLNVPPDKTGKISQTDMKHLAAWRALHNRIFADNLARSAEFTIKQNAPVKFLLDGNDATSLTPALNCIEMQLNGTKTFNVLLLQENIRKGQRIEAFVFECWKNGKWEIIAEGTTVGYKRLLRFKPVSTDKIRLQIVSSRLEPHFAELGLYLYE